MHKELLATQSLRPLPPPTLTHTQLLIGLRKHVLFTILLASLAKGIGSDGKEPACIVGALDSIPGSGRSPGGGHGNPLQYSCLENPMDRGAWWATVHGVAERHDRVSNTQDAPCCPDLFSIHFKHPVRLPGSHQMHLSFSKSFLSPASHLQDESIPMGLFFSLCMAS